MKKIIYTWTVITIASVTSGASLPWFLVVVAMCMTIILLPKVSFGMPVGTVDCNCALSAMSAKAEVKIVDIASCEELPQRLEAFGILPGSIISLCHAEPSRPLVIEFRGTFLAISRRLAGHILVEKE